MSAEDETQTIAAGDVQKQSISAAITRIVIKAETSTRPLDIAELARAVRDLAEAKKSLFPDVEDSEEGDVEEKSIPYSELPQGMWTLMSQLGFDEGSADKVRDELWRRIGGDEGDGL